MVRPLHLQSVEQAEGILEGRIKAVAIARKGGDYFLGNCLYRVARSLFTLNCIYPVTAPYNGFPSVNLYAKDGTVFHGLPHHVPEGFVRFYVRITDIYFYPLFGEYGYLHYANLGFSSLALMEEFFLAQKKESFWVLGVSYYDITSKQQKTQHEG